MQFVIVEYPTLRKVRRNESAFGVTQSVQQCAAGLHTFDLGSPRDYTPLSQDARVRDTTPLRPMRIKFQPREAAFITLQPPASAPPPARKRKAARKTSLPRKRKSTR